MSIESLQHMAYCEILKTHKDKKFYMTTTSDDQ